MVLHGTNAETIMDLDMKRVNNKTNKQRISAVLRKIMLSVGLNAYGP